VKKTLFEELKKDLSLRQLSFKQVAAFIILVMIVMVFVFFGYSSKNSIGMGSAAEVNGVILSQADYQREYARLEQMYSSVFKSLGNSMGQQGFLKSQAMESLISQELNFQASVDLGVRVSDAEILESITQEVDAFKDAGRFQRERYEAVLKANHWSPAEFEKQVRKEKSVQHMRRLFEYGMGPSQLQLAQEQLMASVQKNIGYLSWNTDEYAQMRNLADSVVNAELQKPEFKTRVEAEFDARKASLMQPEKVKARHILIKINPEDPGSEKNAKIKIEDVKKQLGEKQDFVKLAKKYSEDMGTKDKGGDLGYFSKGQMVPEFEKSAFELNKGEMSEIIKTQYGYHILQVTDKQGAISPNFSEWEKKIAKDLVVKDEYEKNIKELEDLLVAKQGDQAEALLSKWGFNKWTETGLFSLADKQAGQIKSEYIKQAAWGLTVNQKWPQKLYREENRIYVLKFLEEKQITPAVTQSELKAQLTQTQAGAVSSVFVKELQNDSEIQKNSALLGSPL